MTQTASLPNSDRPDWEEEIENNFKVTGKKIGRHKFKIVENIFKL